jgi:hypothetical protein
MAQLPAPTIRDVLLKEIKELERHPEFTQQMVLESAATKLGVSGQTFDRAEDQAILTQWGELFRTGLLAWGTSLGRPDPPFFHLTDQGRKALENLSRDPSNPLGYLRHLASIAAIDAVSMSYLTEALDCYVAGLFKAAAVMVGGSAESMILNLRNHIVATLKARSQQPPTSMESWKIKTVSEALICFFDKHKSKFPDQLRDAYEAYWSAFGLQIRTTRNDAGHPKTVDPVTPDTVHAALLVFPELARLSTRLTHWVSNDLK